MKSISLFSALLLAANVAQPQAPRHSVSPNASATLSAPAHNPQPAPSYGRLPLAFEPNRGQTATQVQWLARGPEYTLFLTGSDAVLELHQIAPAKTAAAPTLRSSALRMNLLNALPPQQAAGEQPLPGNANYFTGKDSSKWQRNVPMYAQVSLAHVYPGVDLIYHGRNGQLEYDFVVAPGADASAIQLRFDGASLTLAANGDLLLPIDNLDNAHTQDTQDTQDTQVRFNKPIVYQLANGVRQPVAATFTIAQNRQVSFTLGAYDKSRELIIDPTLIFDGTLGTGNQQTLPSGMTVDTSGEIVITGLTNDLTFPIAGGALQPDCQTYSADAKANNFVRCGPSSTTSAFVTKISADGTSLIYSTYLHGGGGAESGQSVAVDAAGDAYVLGDTSSNDFPITSDAFQTLCQPDYPVLSFYPTNVYGPLTAECNNFHNGGGTEYTVNGPTLFIAKLNPTGTALLYSTFFGGSAPVYPVGIALDSTGNIYFASSVNAPYTASQIYPRGNGVQFPLTSSGYQTTAIGVQEPALSKLSPDGHTLLYSTLIGSQTTGQNNYSLPQAFALGQNGVAFLGGWTYASDYPTTSGSIKTACTLQASSTTNCSNAQAFVSAFDTTQTGASSLLYSTFLGGNAAQGSNIPEQEVYGLAADSGNNLYVTGYTYANDFPTTTGVYQAACASNCSSAFLGKINPTGSALVWSTFLGGTTATGTASSTGNAIALDGKNQVYLYGLSADGGGDFPQVNPLQPYTSGNKVFLATFSPDATQLLFSTRFGSGSTTVTSGSEPIANGIALDAAGNIYFAGVTNDNGSFVTTPGTYATTATAGFNRGFFGKISPVLTTSSTALTISPSSATAGQSVSFTAVVTSPAQTTPVPSGTVVFTNPGTTPATQLGAGTLDASGTAVFSTSSLTAGTYNIVATYSGDTEYDVSASAPAALTVSAGSPSATTLTTSATTAGVNMGVMLTATVTKGATGTVNFFNGTTMLGSASLSAAGAATFTATFNAAGSYSLTAVYAGDANFSPSTSSVVTQTIVNPTFNVTAAPTALTIVHGSTGTSVLTATSVGGFAGTLSFACGTLPSSASCSFAPATVALTAGGSAQTTTLTLNTQAATTSSLRGLPGLRPFAPEIIAAILLLPLGFTRRLKFASGKAGVWRKLPMLLLFAAVGALALGISGCGGSKTPTPAPPSTAATTPAGTYTVPVLVTSGGASMTVNLQLTVQ